MNRTAVPDMKPGALQQLAEFRIRRHERNRMVRTGDIRPGSQIDQKALGAADVSGHDKMHDLQSRLPASKDKGPSHHRWVNTGGYWGGQASPPRERARRAPHFNLLWPDIRPIVPAVTTLTVYSHPLPDLPSAMHPFPVPMRRLR